MYSTSSAASADSVSDSKEPACEQSRSARLTPTAEPCSPSTGQACLASQTFVPWALNRSPAWIPSMSSAEDSPVSRTQSQVDSLVAPILATWSARCSDLLKRLNQPGLLEKTPKALSISGWTPCVMTWQVSATPRGRLVSRLALLDYLPWNGICGLLPRPQASDSKGAGKSRYRLSKMERKNFREVIREAPTDGIYPRPDFVEWVKGFPIGWTDCEHLETQSIRGSQKSSAAQSCAPQAE